MQMCWNTFSHSEIGTRSLEDIIEIISGQLIALGHTSVWGKDVRADVTERNRHFVSGDNGINIIVEGFREHHIPTIADMHARGARFIVLATEEPTEKGFNYGTQQEMVERQQVFPLVAPYVDGIIHLVPGDHVTSWYGQFAPAAYTELGWSPQIMRKPNPPIAVKKDGVVQKIISEPDYEFGFFGSLTPRRHKLLKKLARKVTNNDKAIVLMHDFGTRTDRDNEMRRAKVILQLRKFDEMGLVSSSRCNTALAIGRPVIAEPHDLAYPWNDVVRFSKTQESFFDEAMAVRAMWRGVYQHQLAKFRSTFPPEACIGRALEQLGIGAGAAEAGVVRKRALASAMSET
jgi:hypothetical protein